MHRLMSVSGYSIQEHMGHNLYSLNWVAVKELKLSYHDGYI